MQAAHLLKYDSMLGTFKANVKVVDNETISVDGKLIKVVSSRDPLKLPWAEMGIDIVIEVCFSLAILIGKKVSIQDFSYQNLLQLKYSVF